MKLWSQTFLIFLFLLICMPAVELRERILVWKREKKKAASSLWRVIFPHAWTQAWVLCECGGVAMISVVAQYACRWSAPYCAKLLFTVYLVYAAFCCLPLSHNTTVAVSYTICSNSGRTHLLPIYGLNKMSCTRKAIKQTPYEGMHFIIVCVCVCVCVCMCKHVCVCVHACLCTCTRTCMCTYLYVCMVWLLILVGLF
jgi:hypothetical protein